MFHHRPRRIAFVSLMALAVAVCLAAGTSGAQATSPTQKTVQQKTRSAKPTIRWDEPQQIVAEHASWPRLLVDGEVGSKQRADLLFYTSFVPDQPAIIHVLRSTDQQSSWQELSQIPSPEGLITEQAFPLRVDDESIIIATRSRTTDNTSFSLPVFRSTDDGVSWTRIGTMDENPDAGGVFNRGVWEPFLMQMDNGCIIGQYASELHADDEPSFSQTISQRISCDGGVTWGDESFVASSPGDARPGMPGLARLDDGRWMAVFEACVTDDCNVHYKISRDGRTWAPGLGTQIPHQNAGPYLAALQDGSLLVTSACTNEVSISTDSGTTWRVNPTKPVDIACSSPDSYPYTWPALYQTGRHRVTSLVNLSGGEIVLRHGEI